MSRLAVEANASGSIVRISGSYSSGSWSLGTLINQFQDTAGNTTIGPNVIAVARTGEESTSILTMRYPHVITFSPTIDWIFLTETTAATTARVFLYEYNKVTSKYNWKGFITATFPGALAMTPRGFRVARYLHTSGSSIQTSGSFVTGFGTQFVSERLATGSRIGFGSNDPTQISTWFPISSIQSDTALTTSFSVGTASYSQYVIDELRPMWGMTCATTPTGGLYVAKGINYGDFTTGGTTIPAAVSADFQKAVYWLSDTLVATAAVTASTGLLIDNYTNFLSHSMYIIDISGATGLRCIQYNVRATGSVAGGRMILSPPDSTTTGQFSPIVGTMSQVNNGRLATTAHGPGSGSKGIYFVTTTRFYRADASLITAGNTTWVSDNRTEVPPGGVNTYPATANLSTLEYADVFDKFLVLSTGATAFRHYITVYPTNSGDQWTHIFGVDTKQTDQGAADSTNQPRFDGASQPISAWSQGGTSHLLKMGGAAASSQMYALPFGVHWTYSSITNQRAITPALLTPNCNKYVRVYVNDVEYIGDTGEIGQVATEPFRVSYRTSGIADNSGGWTLLGKNLDLSSVGAAPAIQFMIEFKTIGNGLMVPAQIYGVSVIYDDLSTDSHYQPSVGNSSAASKVFAWRHAVAFGGTVPTLRVRLFDAVTAGTLLDDTSLASGSGTWQKSTNSGSSWNAFR